MKPVKFILKTVLVILALHMMFGGKLTTRLQAQDDDTFIYSLILDKTGSMMGRGDGLGDTIWFEVQNYLMGFIDMIDYNTMVIVYPFHGSVDPPSTFFINSTGAKQELRNYIRNITPNGQNTAIYKALDDALNDLNENYPNNPKLIYLITDGHDNASPTSYSFSDNLNRFSAIRGEFDHLYYIDLRRRAQPHDIEIANRDRHTHILPGFTRPIEIRAWHNPIPVGIEDGRATFIQDFEIRGFELPDDFIFNCRLETDPANNINIGLLPSLNISKSQLEQIEEGRYRMRFELELLAGSIDESISVTARLTAPNISSEASGTVDLNEFAFLNMAATPASESFYNYTYNYEYVVNFNPASFILNVELNVPRVSTPEGGWR